MLVLRPGAGSARQGVCVRGGHDALGDVDALGVGLQTGLALGHDPHVHRDDEVVLTSLDVLRDPGDGVLVVESSVELRTRRGVVVPGSELEFGAGTSVEKSW